MQDAREHILETALQLFSQNSYREVTMSGLVKASGLSKGAFYHYFSSKEQLFEAVIERFYSGQMQVDYSCYSHESLHAFYGDHLQRIVERLNQHLVEAVEEGTLRASHFLLLLDALKRLPAFQALHERRQELELAEWSAVVRQARATGEIQTSLPDTQVAKLFIFLGDGIAINHMLQHQTGELQQEIKASFDALYQQFRA
jgi:TetR/AcrR family transcriptional repressor of nem operon